MALNYGAVIKRFFTDWQQFGLMGVGAFLINLVAGSLGSILAGILVGPATFSLMRADLMGYHVGVGGIGALSGSFIGFALLAAVLGVVAAGLSTAGLIGSVIAYRRGEPVSLGNFWRYARRYVGKIILLGVIVGVVMMISAVVLVIPVLGWLVWIVWAPMIALNLALYPAYLVINQGYTVGDAVGTGFRIISGHCKEALIGALIFLGIGVVIGIVSTVPLVGWLAAGIFGQPLLAYFFVERFEAEVRPKLQL